MDRNVQIVASPFWAVALILFWLHSCEDGKRIMNAIDRPLLVTAPVERPF